MSVHPSVSVWSATLNQLLPGIRLPVRKAVALFSLAMVLACHCFSSRIAALVPTSAAVASSRRRFERLLANPHLDDEQVTAALVRGFAEAWPGRPWTLIIDETDKDDRIRSAQILLAYKRRAIPLAVGAFRPNKRGRPALILRLLKLIRDNLPADTQVTVVTDRGLSWPKLLRFCEKSGWHYVLRIQSQTSVWPEAAEAYSRADTFIPGRKNKPFTCRARVFKVAGWCDCWFTAVRAKGSKEPGLLISDQPGAWRQYRRYGQRPWCEEAFRDEKSSGFCWRQSHVEDPAHATRLLVVMMLAMLLCLALGSHLVKRGLRRLLDPHIRRLWSYFTLGLRWLWHLFAFPTESRLPLPVPLVPV
jgi:hypothetical protein